MNITKFQNSVYLKDIESSVKALQALRANPEELLDISFEEYVSKRFNCTMESFYDDLGINSGQDTIQNFFTLPDPSVRWLIPEIFSSAIRLGLRKNPIWPDLIAAEQTIKNPTITVPAWNMSDAAPKKTGQGETIAIGTLSFGSKTLTIGKIGRGIKIPYEVLQYVVVDVVSIFLQDFGVKLNQAIDTLAITTLINGEQANGSESAPVIGVETVYSSGNYSTGFQYRDLLKVWVRMSLLGKNPTAMVGGENAAINILNLPEFKQRQFGTPLVGLDIKTPVPTSSSYYVHGSMPSHQNMVIDRSASLIKYNAQPLLLEAEKIVSNQTEATYATITTGFGIVYRDGRVLVDETLDFASNTFPSYMDAVGSQVVTLS